MLQEAATSAYKASEDFGMQEYVGPSIAAQARYVLSGCLFPDVLLTMEAYSSTSGGSASAKRGMRNIYLYRIVQYCTVQSRMLFVWTIQDKVER